VCVCQTLSDSGVTRGDRQGQLSPGASGEWAQNSKNDPQKIMTNDHKSEFDAVYRMSQQQPITNKI